MSQLKRLFWGKKPQQQQQKKCTKTRWHIERAPSEVTGKRYISWHRAGPVTRSLSSPVTLAEAKSRDQRLTFPTPLLQLWTWVQSWSNDFRKKHQKLTIREASDENIMLAALFSTVPVFWVSGPNGDFWFSGCESRKVRTTSIKTVSVVSRL